MERPLLYDGDHFWLVIFCMRNVRVGSNLPIRLKAGKVWYRRIPAIRLADAQKDSSIQALAIKGEPKSLLFRVSDRPIREDLPVKEVMLHYLL